MTSSRSITLAVTAPTPAPTAPPTSHPTGPPNISPNRLVHTPLDSAERPGCGSMVSCTAVRPSGDLDTTTVILLLEDLDVGALANELARFPFAKLVHTTLPSGSLQRIEEALGGTASA